MGFAEFIASGCISDHTFSLVSCLEEKISKISRTFKFFNMWTLDDKLLDLVTSKWRFSGFGTMQYK